MVKRSFIFSPTGHFLGYLLFFAMFPKLGDAQTASPVPAPPAQPTAVQPSTSQPPPVPTNPADQSPEGLLKNVVGLFPKRVVLVEALEEGEVPEFFKMDPALGKKATYFEIANSPQLDWEAKLNYKKISSMDGIKGALHLSRADTLVHMPKKGDWSLYRESSSAAKSKVISRPGAAMRDLPSITKWIFEALNWDGVVLGKDGDNLVVGSSAEILKGEQLQSLAVDDSHTKYLLSATERKGSGLLSLVKSSGGFGYFTVIFLGAGIKSLPVGTKLIIEKKKAP